MPIKGKQIAFALPAAILALLLIMHLIMWISTAQVLRDVKAVIYGQVEQKSIKGTQLEYFNFAEGHPDAEVSLSMRRICVLCGPRRGCMWVRYSYAVQSKRGNIDTRGANIISHWEIERINGRWEIVSISEDP